jgi:Methyltransferase domain
MLRSWRITRPKAQKGQRQEKPVEEIPLRGYDSNGSDIKFVNALTDTDLIELNSILNWNCFVVDSHGRRFGNAAWTGKRDTPEIIPDRRVSLLNERFGLSDKHVLEFGCFEGIHTVALSEYARRVTAIDVRIENVVKTIVRCALYGHHPTVFKCNVEERPLNLDWLRADVAFHVGVLYHLKDPVEHIFDLAEFVSNGLLLDTHYSPDDKATEQYESHGRIVRYKKYVEGGYSDPFSGIYDHSKWLRVDDIRMLLRDVGFSKIDVVETRQERNGPRVLLIARRA